MNDTLYEKINKRHDMVVMLLAEFMVRQKDPLNIFKEYHQHLNPTVFTIEFDQLKEEYPKTYKVFLGSILKAYMYLGNLPLLYQTYRDELENEIYISLLNCIQTVISHLHGMLNLEPDVQAKMQKDVKPSMAKPKLTRDQTALFFWYLREKSLITQFSNEDMSIAIESLTGYSSGQIQNVLRAAGTPVCQLGKDNKKVTKTDFKAVISTIEELLEKIKKDLRVNSENNELR